MLILLFVFSIIVLVYWLFILIFLRNSLNNSSLNNNNEPVSIIICIKNEIEQLKSNLQLILHQDYPEFELILIDDNSTDGSYEYALSVSKKYNNIKLVQYTKNHIGKKDLLSIAVDKASFPWLLFTDADCKPSSRYWIKYMVNNANLSKKIVIGYSPFIPKKTLLNLYVRFEAQIHAFLYLSFAIAGFPYMAVGRNVLYHKSIFSYQEMDPSIPYGDDDILINKKANARNTIVCLHPKSIMHTKAPYSLIQYLSQKRRHMAASLKYSPLSQFLLMGFYGSLVVFFLLLLIVSYTNPMWAFIIYLFHLLIIWPAAIYKSKILHDNQAMYFFPVLEVLFVTHLLIQAPFLFFPKKTW